MEAGMLSVAMTAGEERIFAWLSDSMSVTVPSSSRLLPTSAAADKCGGAALGRDFPAKTRRYCVPADGR